MIRPQSLDALQQRAAEVAGIMKLLSHPTRLIIACELSDGEKSVAALAEATGAAAPNLSRDLARMRAEGLVIARRQAKSVIYQIADERLARVIGALCEAFPTRANSSKRRKS